MAKEIILNTPPIASEEVLQQVFDAFERQTGIHVNFQVSAWDFSRQDFTNIALHHLKADVLIASMSITSDLIAMAVLRPFAKHEVSKLGGEEAFLPSRWRSVIRPGAPEVWAIPLVTDSRVLYYNRNLLHKAGIEESSAFKSPQQIEKTIIQLHACGVDVPWYLIIDHYGVLHRVASWIWAYGGDLFAPDGKKVLYYEKEALEGMRAYLRLVSYATLGTGQKAQEMLRSGRAAALIENSFLLFEDAPSEIGCAPVPGGSYVGGSDMMIWKHTHNEAEALELVNFLSRPEITAQFLPKFGASPQTGLPYYLPVRMSQLNALASGSNPLAKAMVQSTVTGRTFPCVPMIGLTEDRLGIALASIQQELKDNPQVDVEKLLQQRVVSMGKRMNLALGTES